MSNYDTNTKIILLLIYFSPSLPKDKKTNNNRDRDDGRLTKLMLLIFICFVSCFLPLMLVNVFDDDTHFPVLNVLASVLAWASSVINPFIYAASNRQYRAAYSKLFNIVKSSVAFSDINSQKSRGITEKNFNSTNKPNSSVQT